MNFKIFYLLFALSPFSNAIIERYQNGLYHKDVVSREAATKLEEIEEASSKLVCGGYCKARDDCNGFNFRQGLCSLFHLSSKNEPRNEDDKKHVYIDEDSNLECEWTVIQQSYYDNAPEWKAEGVFDDNCNEREYNSWYGKTRTRNQGFTLDFGCRRNIRGVTLRNQFEGTVTTWGTKKCKIEVSEDNTDWVILVFGTLRDQSSKESCNVDLESFNRSESSPGRYLKFTAETYYGYGGAGLQYLGIES